MDPDVKDATIQDTVLMNLKHDLAGDTNAY